MINLNELEHFVALEKYKTLTKVAENFHISSPTITRSMQNIEESFGVSLFNRNANRIVLNETGEKALELSKYLLEETKRIINEVKLYDQTLKTVSIKSVAPMPMWKIIPIISSYFPNMTISSNIALTKDILSAIENKEFDIVILPYKPNTNEYPYKKLLEEKLMISVPITHELATKPSVSFGDINGFNFLLKNNLGFWDTLCREKMPSSKFLVQNNDFEFTELIKNSSLPHFITDLFNEYSAEKFNRVVIPIKDNAANISFYILFKDYKIYNILKNII